MYKWICCVVIFLFSLNVFSKKPIELYNIPLASEHLLEPAVEFLQGDDGEIWLLSQRSISLYRAGEFVSYRSFDLKGQVTSGVIIGSNLYVSTADSIFQLSINHHQAQLNKIWQVANDNVVNLLKFEQQLVIQTQRQLYKLNNTEQQTNSINAIYTLTNKVKKVRVVPQGILVVTPNKLALFSKQQQAWMSVEPESQLQDAVEFHGQLVYLTTQGKVQIDNPFHFSSELDPQSIGVKYNEQPKALIPSYDDVLLQFKNSLVSLRHKSEVTSLANNMMQPFVDSHNNVWLSNGRDVQVNWSQPFDTKPLIKTTKNQSRTFDVLSTNGLYALDNNRLYQHRKRAGRHVWQHKVTLTNLKDVEQLIETKRHIWFVSTNRVWSYEKQTLLPTANYPLEAHRLVFPFGDNQLLIVTENEIRSISATGSSEQHKITQTCKPNCLPNYNVTDYLSDGDVFWLASNRGLHQLNVAKLTFSDKRLDRLQAQAPVVRVLTAQDGKLWVVYPTKVALFDTSSLTSQMFFINQNRIVDAKVSTNQQLELNTQLGWYQLDLNPVHLAQAQSNAVIKHYQPQATHFSLISTEQTIQLNEQLQELNLAFSSMKQHPSQGMFVRFKYADDTDWSDLDLLSQSLTLKSLRQGSNELQVQLRLEGQPWLGEQVVRYHLPYTALQTKWLLLYAGAALFLFLVFVLYERFKGSRMAFDTIKQQAFITSLLQSTKDGVWVANKDREIQSINNAYAEITGYQLDEVTGKSFQLFNHQGRNHEVESLIWQEVTKSGFWAGEVWSKHKNGDDVSFDLSVTRVESEHKLRSKTSVTFVGVFSDVTIRKKSEQELRHMATRDPLTDLPNRTLFIEYIDNAINTTNRFTPQFAVVFIDLDNFRKVNESLGPTQGDELIKQVSVRFSQCLGKGVVLARLGGDEFGLLIPSALLGAEPNFYISRVAESINDSLEMPISLQTTGINISASLGVALSPKHGNTAESVMRCADTALTKVKRSGKNNYFIYRPSMDTVAADLLSLESELIHALEHDQFVVYYQPKFKLKENKVSGFEALVRWDHPERGLISPAQFIQLAEDNGLIRKLDTWVFKQVCQQIRTWKQQGCMVGKVSVNVSALNFQQVDFCQNLKDVLVSERVESELIELEITETAMMTDPSRALEHLIDLRSVGFTIALDDFGTNNSSLGYIKKFPLDRLKIDQSFIADIDTKEQDKNITSAVVQLAKYLDIAVIAEGVESKEQAFILHVMGCNEIQGYFISKPIKPEQVPEFLNQKFDDIDNLN